ncbi:MAG TPA: metallophosphoesterase [Verrucomicrobiae bacterium]|nr:metallophosphoesterase [Verrucomicrobiae bacterium]
MPIHLPPVSRRRFLATSLLAGAGLIFRRNLLAAEKPLDEHFWALLSDTHIAADRKTVARDINMTGHLKRVCSEVIAEASRPAGVMVNGDCAFNSGEPGDYATFTDLLQPLREAGMPLHLTVGNHDDREHFWNSLVEEKNAPRPLANHNVALIETPRANWLILDSLEKTLSTPGLLGAAQLEWLARTLDAHPSKPALVMGHHQTANGGDPKSGLKDSEQLLEIIRPRKQVKAYIYGHTHVWQVKQDESGIHLVNLPPVAYVFEKHQPSGWVRANLKSDGMRLELRCLDRTHKAHGQVVELNWRKA